MTHKKTAVVSGASSGIGLAITKKLLAMDFRVSGIGRDFSRVAPDSAHFTPWQIDLAVLDQLPAQLKRLTGTLETLDTVVCCAGRGIFGGLEEFSYEQIRQLVDLNFTSQVYLVRALLPLLKRRKQGNVIFIGSESALSGGPKGAVYSGTKFALRGLAQALRQECASSGVAVTIINPGMVRSPFFDTLHFQPGADEANYLLPEDVAECVAMVLASRAGTVMDEINLSPQKKVIQFRKPPGGDPY
jgi:NADP-dependent 3-hydroxy acid dehydrogenase YdfG